MNNRMTAEQIEVRVWAFIVVSLMAMLLCIALGILWAVAFEDQAMVLAPIDAVFLEILKAIAFMSIGTMGGIAGRKASTAIAEHIAAEPSKPTPEGAQ